MPAPAISVLSVNTALAQQVIIQGRPVLTAIHKRAQTGRLAVTLLGLAGDEQADQTVHGGLSKAIYAYPAAHYAFWQTVRAQARVASFGETLPPGALGENLTLDGALESGLWIGDRLRFADCVLAVSEPRRPCFKFNAAMGFTQASKLMAQSGYCGSYLAVVEPGSIGPGDTAELLPGPREVNLRELFLARMGRQ